MSLEPAGAAGESPPAWPVLSLLERRVLGVLVEKAKSTPDIYPLSLNSLVTGCNQKSNRDPILNVSDLEVEEALVNLQKKGLVMKITGGRVERWRHILYEALHVEKVALAVLAELLLRGPQTEGELRGHASRMEPITDLDALRAELRPLAQRRLILYLMPESRRGTVLTHGFHEPKELERFRAKYSGHSEPLAAEETSHLAATIHPNAPAASAFESGLQEANAQIAELRATVADLDAKIASLAEQVRVIQEGLGI